MGNRMNLYGAMKSKFVCEVTNCFWELLMLTNITNEMC